MQGHNTTSRRVAAVCTAIALGLVIGPTAPAAIGGAGEATGTLPGDTSVPFWPLEIGAPFGTAETFVDMRADGSYFDPSIGRRVAGGAESKATRPDDRAGVRGPMASQTVAVRAERNSFDWGDALLGGVGGVAAGFSLTGLLFLVAARRSKIARIA